MKKRICALFLALLLFAGMLVFPAPPAAQAEAAQDYLRCPDGVTAEMMTADYWLSKRNPQAVRMRDEQMTPRQIEEINRLNRNMITIGAHSYALTDIPDVLGGALVRALIESAALPKNPAALYRGGQPTDSAYWEALDARRNLDAVGEQVRVRYGYSVRRASLRQFPSNDFVGAAPGERLYDKLVMSEFMPYLPLAVLHESADGAWLYVLLYGFGGWIEKENVALCPSREDWMARMQPEEFLVVTGRELRLAEEPYAPGVSGLLLPMGTKLPLVRADSAPESVNHRKSYGCYVVRLPVRLENGEIGDCDALVPVSEDVSVGYLPYTRENVLRLAFKLLGDRYGWAGMYGANDCSGIVHEIFSCFGLCLPRTAGEIMALKGCTVLDVSAGSDAQKEKALSDIPAGALLGFPGHIMIYLGKADGAAYVISAVGSFGPLTAQEDYDYAVNGVTVNALAATRRRSGKTWLESLDGILLFPA